jgi:oligopeptide transport system substrate-binding protein
LRLAPAALLASVRSSASLVLCVALAVVGCSKSPPEAPKSQTGKATAGETAKAPARDRSKTGSDAFVFAIQGEPETLDPGRSHGVNETKVVQNLFEGLTEYPLGNGDMVPGVAERWTLDPDGRTYTFHLRKDAKWSNGEPVTAEDFRWSWIRVLDPKLASPYADMLFVLDGARDLYEGRQTDPATVGVEVVDPHTLKVRLAYVAPYFLELLAYPTFRPVHRATVEKHGDRWTRPANIVGNGPYRLVEWSPQQHLKLVKNKHYWDTDDVAIARVTILPIEENTTMVNLFESGELDWSGAVDLPAIKIKQLRRRKDYHEDPYHGVYFYRFNVQHPALKDVKVRRALAKAVDREAIIEVLKSGHRVATTYVPPMPGYTAADSDLDFDPDAARKLLAEAGYPEGRGFPRLTVLYNTQENHKRVAEMVQQMWARTLGIEISLQNQEWKVYLNSQKQLAYEISRSGWIGDYHDPSTFLSMWTTGNGNNNTGWSDREYDGLIEKANHEADAAARLDILRRAEALLLSRGPVMPLYHYARPYLLSRAVEGFEPHLLDLHPVKYIRKTP